jgi:hypothetical protein
MHIKSVGGVMPVWCWQHVNLTPAQVKALSKSLLAKRVTELRKIIYQSFRKSWSAGGTHLQVLDHFDVIRVKVSVGHGTKGG